MSTLPVDGTTLQAFTLTLANVAFIRLCGGLLKVNMYDEAKNNHEVGRVIQENRHRTIQAPSRGNPRQRWEMRTRAKPVGVNNSS